MTIKQNNTNISDLLSKRTAAIKKHLTDPSIVIPVGGKACHPSDLVDLFQRDADARTAVDAAHAAVKSTIAVRKTADSERRAADSSLKSYVVHLYGDTSAVALEFGYPPPKPKAMTVATKAAAIQKSAATRAARGTKGSVQRTEVSGTTLVFSSEAAAAAAAAKAPAPPAGAPVLPLQSHPAPPVTGSPPLTPSPMPAPTPPAPVVNGTNGAAH